MKEFTAKDARELGYEAHRDELNLIIEEIKTEASKVHSNEIIYWYESISRINQEKLRNNGFTLTYHDKSENINSVEHFTIEW